MSASPGAAAALTRMNMEIDIREILPAIRVPTLIIHRAGDQTVSVENGRFLAEHIPGARYVELPGDDHLPFAGDQDEILREVELFLTGALAAPSSSRVLATLMFTGIVGAATTAVQQGEQAWAEILAAYDEIVRDRIALFRGREAKKAIGGSIATFDGPARAIQCACAIIEDAQELGISVRIGLHAGECEIIGGEIRGVAVQVAERVFDRAVPGEVLVSSTVKDLVAGSGIAFEELEGRLLTGPERGWRLHRVVIGTLATRVKRPARAREDTERSPALLSPREREVVVQIASGLSNRQIAEELTISPATVERHVSNILIKLDFQSRAQVAAWAVRQDLLSGG